MGVQRVGEQYQVIIGQNVAQVYPEVLALTGLQAQAAVDENLDGDKAPLTFKSAASAVLDFVSGSIVACIPVFMVAGLFTSIQVVLGPIMFGVITEESSLYTFLDVIYNAGMYYLPFYLAWSTANKLGVRPALALMLAGILLSPTFLGVVNAEGGALDFLGIPIRLVDYSQSVVPIMLSVWVMSYVEKFFKKVVPDLVSFMFVPFLTIAVMAPVALIVLAPIGAALGDLVASGMMALYNAGGVVRILALAFLTAVQQLLIVVGMHMALLPIAFQTFAVNGSEPFIIVANFLANFAVWGGALAAAIRFKDPEEKSTAFGGFVSGIIGGVNEPNIFGVFLTHRRMLAPMIAANAIVGALAAILSVACYSPGHSSIMCLFTFISPTDPSNFVNACICGAVGFVLGFVGVWFFGLTKEDVQPSSEAAPAIAEPTRPVAVSAASEGIAAPVSGRIEKTANIPDPVFAGEAMGTTVAVWPEDGVVYAPVSGTVTAAMPHAVGLMGDNGAEVLIHIGVDTVSMNGEGFATWIKDGQHVDAGEALVSFDRAAVEAAGHPDIVMCIVTNSDDLAGLAATAQGSVSAGEQAFAL